MRTFEHFNSEIPCPVCGTAYDRETILIGINGTRDGNNIQTIQVHTECLQELIYDKDFKLIYILADK